jgi:hypothetical protein
MRAIFDQGGIGMVLIGMPGLEKQLARYPQLVPRLRFLVNFPVNVTVLPRYLSPLVVDDGNSRSYRVLPWAVDPSLRRPFPLH